MDRRVIGVLALALTASGCKANSSDTPDAAMGDGGAGLDLATSADLMTAAGDLAVGPLAASYAVDKTDPDYLAGEDWQVSSGYSSSAQLQAIDQFGSSDTTCFPADLYASGHISLQPAAPFGQVVDLSYPACSTAIYIEHVAAFTPQPRVWFRATYRWRPGYTAKGANPMGYANSQKHMFMLWQGANSRKEWEYTNTTDYHQGLDFRHTDGNNTKYGFTETDLPGSNAWNPVTNDWTNDEWYEFVFWYEITQAGPYGKAKHGAWKRRLTSGGAIAPGAWEWTASSIDFTANPLMAGTGESPPLCRAVNLFANRNKSVDAPFHIQVGPYLVSKAADPFGLKALFGL